VACEKTEHWARAKFFLEKVSIKLLFSGTAGKYENKEKGYSKQRGHLRPSLKKKESHPIRGPLTIWGHN
jgi:hypothetical protein